MLTGHIITTYFALFRSHVVLKPLFDAARSMAVAVAEEAAYNAAVASHATRKAREDLASGAGPNSARGSARSKTGGATSARGGRSLSPSPTRGNSSNNNNGSNSSSNRAKGAAGGGHAGGGGAGAGESTAVTFAEIEANPYFDWPPHQFPTPQDELSAALRALEQLGDPEHGGDSEDDNDANKDNKNNHVSSRENDHSDVRNNSAGDGGTDWRDSAARDAAATAATAAAELAEAAAAEAAAVAAARARRGAAVAAERAQALGVLEAEYGAEMAMGQGSEGSDENDDALSQSPSDDDFDRYRNNGDNDDDDDVNGRSHGNQHLVDSDDEPDEHDFHYSRDNTAPHSAVYDGARTVNALTAAPLAARVAAAGAINDDDGHAGGGASDVAEEHDTGAQTHDSIDEAIAGLLTAGARLPAFALPAAHSGGSGGSALGGRKRA